MFRKRKKVKVFLVLALFLGLAVFAFIFLTNPEKAEKISWGVNFSQDHAEKLGLDWKETYLALLDDLGAKFLKIAAQWDLVEPREVNDLIEPGSIEYNFEDLDWQINQAQKRNAKILLVVGVKTPRWPECHIPDWAKNLTKEQQQGKIINLISAVVLRYQDSQTIWAWQVENEPFFAFGECPWKDENFLKKEIALVKGLDQKKRPVIISDTGELSLWLKAAKNGDLVAATLYRKVWVKELGLYAGFPFPPNYYWRRAQVINKIFNKKVIVGELQSEPWGKVLLYDSPLSEQEKTMNLAQFKSNIEFAKQTGLDEFYFWGAEWWYWMKEKQNQPEIWDEARKQITNNQ